MNLSQTKEVGTLSTELTCDAVKDAIFIPCSPAICGFVIMTKSFFPRSNMLTQTKLIKPVPFLVYD